MDVCNFHVSWFARDFASIFDVQKSKQKHLRSKPDLTKVAVRLVDIYASAVASRLSARW